MAENIRSERRAALLIHGFMGCPKQFDFMHSTLTAAGYDIYPIMLPGHGATVIEFACSNRREWLQSVKDEIIRLQDEYDHIHIITHSMGGLLSILAAVENPVKIMRITAIALPLCIGITRRAISIRAKAMQSERKTDPEELKAMRRMNSVSGITPWNSIRLLPNTFGLLRLIYMTRRILPGLRVPLTVINSNNDELVSPRTINYLHRYLPSARTITLCKSSHFWFTDKERESIQHEIL